MRRTRVGIPLVKNNKKLPP